MKKNSIPVFEQPNLAKSLSENPYLLWVSENGRILLYACIALTLALFFVYRLSSGNYSKAETDYIAAESDYRTFHRPSNSIDGPSNQEEAFANLQEILKRQPDLHPKYDGLIAQTLINRGETKEAQKFADLSFKRTNEENEPFYHGFAQTTLVIANQDYTNALAQATELKQKMLANAELPKDKRDFGDHLFALNLLRIAVLQQQLGLSTEELKTWEEWKGYAGLSNENESLSKSIDRSGFETVLSLFNEGKTSLANYIEEREKTLSQ